MNTCKNCKWWEHSIQHIVDNNQYGCCWNDEKIFCIGDLDPDKEEDVLHSQIDCFVMTPISNIEDGVEFVTGENFGCIHFEDKK